MAEKNKKILWTKHRAKAAEALAEGYTIKEAAEASGLSTRTIDRLKTNLEFTTEVDRLALMTGISSRAERLRIAKRVIRKQMKKSGGVYTKKDILEWLKYAADETDEVRLNLADLIGSHLATKRQEDKSISETGSDGSNEDNPGE